MKATGLMIPAVFFAAITAQAANNMNAFPAAEEGSVRYVLHLPKLEMNLLSKLN